MKENISPAEITYIQQSLLERLIHDKSTELSFKKIQFKKLRDILEVFPQVIKEDPSIKTMMAKHEDGLFEFLQLLEDSANLSWTTEKFKKLQTDCVNTLRDIKHLEKEIVILNDIIFRLGSNDLFHDEKVSDIDGKIERIVEEWSNKKTAEDMKNKKGEEK